MSELKEQDKPPSGHVLPVAWAILIIAGGSALTLNIWHASDKQNSVLLAGIAGTVPVLVAGGMAHIGAEHRSGKVGRFIIYLVVGMAMLLSVKSQADKVALIFGKLPGFPLELRWLYPLMADVATFYSLNVIMTYKRTYGAVVASLATATASPVRPPVSRPAASPVSARSQGEPPTVASPVRLTGEAGPGFTAPAGVKFTKPFTGEALVKPAGELTGEAGVKVTGEAGVKLTGEASGAVSGAVAEALHRQAAGEVTGEAGSPRRKARKSTPQSADGEPGKPDLRSLPNDELVKLISQELSHVKVSANQIRMRWRIGAGPAGEVYNRWERLTGEGAGEGRGASPAPPHSPARLTGEPAGEPFTSEAFTSEPLTGEPLTGEPLTSEAFTSEPFTSEAFTGDPFTGEAATDFTSEPFTPAAGEVAQ